jgi:GNAT superfamily N-acetyltransferase
MSDQMEWPNMIFDLQLTDDNTDKILTELSKDIHGNELPEFLIIDSLAKTRDFDKAARNAGFMPVMRWPGMIYDLALSEKDTVLPSELAIVKVSNIVSLCEWVAIANKTLFPGKGIDAGIIEPLIYSNEISFFLAYYNNVPVSTILVNYNRETAGLYIVSTLPDYSGRGFMTTLFQFVNIEAYKQGYRFSILEATSQSHRLYTSLGYKDVCNFYIFWKMH